MTREEREAAIEYIKGYRKLDEDLHNTAPKDSVSYYATDKCLKYWDMAIQALSQEPTVTSTDEPMTMVYPTIVCDDAISLTKEAYSDLCLRASKADDLQRALDMEKGAYNALVKNIQCDDAISREAVKDILNNSYSLTDAEHRVEQLPSVTQKSGEWLTNEIIHDGCKYTVTYCSECDEQADYRTPFCPNCGAKMVKPQERSDKE